MVYLVSCVQLSALVMGSCHYISLCRGVTAPMLVLNLNF